MRKQWFLIALSILLMTLLVVSCGIPQDQYDTVVAERDSTQAELQSVKAEVQSVKTELATSQSKVLELTSNLEKGEAELEATKKELTDIKKVYPPRQFSSSSELVDWLRANDVSERPPVERTEQLYAKGLDIQADALKDGFIISVNIEPGPEPGTSWIGCVTVINGDMWVWGPENDEPTQATGFAKIPGY